MNKHRKEKIERLISEMEEDIRKMQNLVKMLRKQLLEETE